MATSLLAGIRPLLLVCTLGGLLLPSYILSTSKSEIALSHPLMSPHVGELTAKLQRRVPIFAELQAISKQPAISIGVLHHGEKIFIHSLGRKNVKETAPPDENTLYCVASLTKQIFSASISSLVAGKKIDWDTRISTILPSFANAQDPIVGQRVTVRDLLSHRSGLSSLDVLVQGLDGELTIDPHDVVAFANALPTVADFRTKWSYSNFGYSIVASAIDQIAEKPWSQYMEEHVFKQLLMDRTTSDKSIHLTDDNIARTYVVLSDGSPVEVPPAGLESKSVNGAAGGIRSTVNDILTWSEALMTSGNSSAVLDIGHDNNSPTNDDVSASISKGLHLSEILESSIIINPAFTGDMVYGLGIVRQTTPATLGVISPNRDLAASPLIGKESPPRTIYSHNGDFNGATTSLYMVPDSTSAVVVLSNARGLSDATDWIAQDILQTLFEFQPPVDFVSEAQKSRRTADDWFRNNIQRPLEDHRLAVPDDRRRPDYYGVYQLSGYTKFSLEVTEHTNDTSKLILEVNGRASQRHILSYYHYDVWEFSPASYDDYVRKGYGPYNTYHNFLISFQRRGDGKINALEWHMDDSNIIFLRSHE